MQILQTLLTMVLGTLVWVIVTLCTRPEDMETLKEFYLRARPMGYWRSYGVSLEMSMRKNSRSSDF